MSFKNIPLEVIQPDTNTRFRLLTSSERDLLIKNGCTCLDWNTIFVGDFFCPSKVVSSHFFGHVYIEGFTDHTSENSLPLNGIYNSNIQNCYIGKDTLIRQVGLIANYRIGDNCRIENVHQINVESPTTFGINSAIEVLDETGSRTIRLHPRLNTPIAYLIMSQRDPEFQDSISKVYERSQLTRLSNIGSIGSWTCIINCGTIHNVHIGDFARLFQVTRLKEGWIDSSELLPTLIEDNVIALNFHIGMGSEIKRGVHLQHTFVGQCSKLMDDLSVKHSFIGGNCQLEEGEICASFLGPFSVSMHKSTLLIGGCFSFFNAGSNTNQSNHLYKLGPVHYGILSRGCKTGSGSYLMWPARIAPFTLIVGKHVGHPDTRNLPFSYLIESSGKSILAPAANLFTTGTLRDSEKWGKRNRQLLSCFGYDYANTETFTPYTIEQIINGIGFLEQLGSGENGCGHYSCSGFIINESARKKGIKLYQTAVDLYLGELLYHELLLNHKITTVAELNQLLNTEVSSIPETWADLGGMLLPQSMIDKLREKILCHESGLEEIYQHLGEILQSDIQESKWKWCLQYLRENKRTDIPSLIGLAERWSKAIVDSTEYLLRDLEREFGHELRSSFVLEGCRMERDKEFLLLRGEFEDNHWAIYYQERAQNLLTQASELGTLLESLN